MVRRWFRTFWCVGQQWCSRRLCAEVKIVGTTTIISKRCHHHHYYYYYYNFVCVYVACSVHSATIKWKRQQHLQMVLALSVEYTIIMHKRPGYNGIASSDWAFFTALQKGDCVWANQTKIKTLFSSRGSSSVVVDILHRLYIDDISCWEILKCYAAWRHNAFNHSTMYAGALHWGIISGLTLMMCWHYKIILIELSRLDHDCKEGRFDTCTHTRHWTSQWISFYKLPDTESR